MSNKQLWVTWKDYSLFKPLIYVVGRALWKPQFWKFDIRQMVSVCLTCFTDVNLVILCFCFVFLFTQTFIINQPINIQKG